MWPTKPKRFTIWPFTGKVCNLWGGGKGRALSCMGGSLGGGQEPCSCPLRRYPSPTSPDSWSLWRAPLPPLAQAWPLWSILPPPPRPGLFGGPHFPCPLHGPSELVLPANTCSVDERLSQPPHRPRPADPVPGHLPAQPAPPRLARWSCVALSQVALPLGLSFFTCLASGSDYPFPGALQLQTPVSSTFPAVTSEPEDHPELHEQEGYRENSWAGSGTWLVTPGW